jgi:hypothetical protein
MDQKSQKHFRMKTTKLFSAMALSLAFLFILITPVKAQDETDKKSDKHGKGDFTMGNVRVEQSGEDTMVIYINKSHRDHCTNFSTMPWGCKKNKFNGHWAGIDFGWNGYVNSDFNMNFPDEVNYMDLNTARSLMVNLNPVEINVNIAKNKFGFTTGLGFQLSNYFFNRDYALYGGLDSLAAFRVYDASGNMVTMSKSKLFVSYLTLPLLFEVQTNPKCKTSSFHFTAGVIGGLRLQSYQKMELTSYDKILYLETETGRVVSSFDAEKPVRRVHDQFFLNPFKVDATVRVGWSFLNLFATYSLTPMYQKDKGPEVYPWSVGITLLGW